MKTLVLGWRQVSKLLPMAGCMDAMEETLKALAQGNAVLPLRQFVRQSDGKGALAVMPGFLGSPSALGLKAITAFPGNEGTRFVSHQGAVLLFGTEHGELRAVLDASSITAIRTAAVSGVATKLLANEGASTLGILGSGVQATSHLESMLIARNTIRKVLVWSRNPDHAKKFAAAHRRSLKKGRTVEVAGSPREAVQGADVICTTTSATSPILKGEWLSPGAHVNAVGASRPPSRELDTNAVVRSRFFVDRLESALNEADDFRIPKQEGAIGDSHIRGEIGEILLGRIQGRTSRDEITVFKSLGLAVEDLASASYIYNRARSKKLGTWVEINAG